MGILRKLAGFADEDKHDIPESKVNKIEHAVEREIKESKAMDGISSQNKIRNINKNDNLVAMPFIIEEEPIKEEQNKPDYVIMKHILQKIKNIVLNPIGILLLLSLVGYFIFQTISNLFIGLLIFELCMFCLMALWLGFDYFLDDDGKIWLFVMILIFNPLIALAGGGNTFVYYVIFLLTIFFIVIFRLYK